MYGGSISIDTVCIYKYMAGLEIIIGCWCRSTWRVDKLKRARKRVQVYV